MSPYPHVDKVKTISVRVSCVLATADWREPAAKLLYRFSLRDIHIYFPNLKFVF